MTRREVLVDTSAWIDFFVRPASASKRTVDRLLDEDAVLLCGIVLAELLQGIKSARELRAVRTHFDALPYAEVDRPSWELAGSLSRTHRSRGLTIPLTDMVIAALALRRDAAVLTLDPHFSAIDGLTIEPMHSI